MNYFCYPSLKEICSLLAQTLSGNMEFGLRTIFPVLNTESFNKILAANKSGSPLDPTPINILQSMVWSVGPTIMKTINASLCTGVVPPLWKKGGIKALLKKTNLDPDCLSNYCPISLLSGVSKIAEKHINQVLSNHLEEGNLLHKSQTGFRPG